MSFNFFTCGDFNTEAKDLFLLKILQKKIGTHFDMMSEIFKAHETLTSRLEVFVHIFYLKVADMILQK